MVAMKKSALHNKTLLQKGQYILLVAGSPQGVSTELLSELADGATFTLGVDSGANLVHAAGLKLDYLVGDLDSVDDVALAAYLADGCKVLAADAYKDETDLELAMVLAESLPTDLLLTSQPSELGSALSSSELPSASPSSELSPVLLPVQDLSLVVTNALGGRVDHELAVLGVLMRSVHLKPIIVEDGVMVVFLGAESVGDGENKARAQLCINEVGAPLDTLVSVIALGGEALVSEMGFVWELDYVRLRPYDPRGVSNRVQSPGACITVHEGTVAVFLYS
ncbi:MAG: thiamine pyrophosphokinase [Coriobacteriia bacterium]|nr:thiamine pyrophosphokinase [Coriobacteriia bacterium]